MNLNKKAMRIFEYLDNKNDNLNNYVNKKWYNIIIVYLITITVIAAPSLILSEVLFMLWMTFILIIMILFIRWAYFNHFK